MTNKKEDEKNKTEDKEVKEPPANYDDSSFSFSYKYSFTNREAKYEPLLVGTICIILSIAVIPIILLVGYMGRLSSYSAKGKKECPRFREFKALTKEGLFFSILILVVVLFGILIDKIALFILPGSESLSIIVSLIPIYILPAVFVTFSVRKFSEPDEFLKETMRFAFSFEYAYGFLVFALSQLIFVLVFIVFLVTTVGLLFLFAIYLYACASFWGHRYYVWNNKRGN